MKIMRKTRIKLNADVSYDPLKQTLTINGKERTLTTTEIELFHLLVSNINDLTERKAELELIWGKN